MDSNDNQDHHVFVDAFAVSQARAVVAAGQAAGTSMKVRAETEQVTAAAKNISSPSFSETAVKAPTPLTLQPVPPSSFSTSSPATPCTPIRAEKVVQVEQAGNIWKILNVVKRVRVFCVIVCTRGYFLFVQPSLLLYTKILDRGIIFFFHNFQTDLKMHLVEMSEHLTKTEFPQIAREMIEEGVCSEELVMKGIKMFE